MGARVEPWVWGLIAILLSAAIGGLVNLSSRAVRAEAKDAADEVKGEIAEVKLDLARNYVQKSDLDEMKKGQEKLLQKVTSIQILLARRLPGGDSIDVRETDLEG